MQVKRLHPYFLVVGSVFCLHIHCRIHIVNILLIEFLPKQLRRLAKPLEVYDFPLPQELDHIVYIRIIGKPQDIVISDPCFLLCQGVP